MLDNAGKKIVLWSQIILYLGIAISVVIGLVLIISGTQARSLHYTYYNYGRLYEASTMGSIRMIIGGFLVILLGSLWSWLSALVLRAFGDMATDTRAMREKLEREPEELVAETPMETVTESPAPAKPKTPAKPRARKPAAPKAAPENTEPEAE